MSTWNQRQEAARKRNRMRNWTVVGLFVLVVVIVGGISLAYLGTKGTETCTVESKERTTHVQDGNSTQQKLVYTKDCGVLTVDDAWYAGKFNSADTYGSLQEGKRYEFETIGWRNGFLSQFPNILSATPVN